MEKDKTQKVLIKRLFYCIFLGLGTMPTMKKNIIRTTFIFLGLIVMGLFARIFIMEDSILLKNDDQTANTHNACPQGADFC